MFNDGGFKMNFEVSELLIKLKTNLKDHKDIFQEATDGYLDSLHNQLSQMLDKVNKKEVIEPDITLEKPRSHEKAYEKAIQMLEFTSDTVITLDQSLFDRYVLDEWDWSGRFLNNANLYGSSVAASKMRD